MRTSPLAVLDAIARSVALGVALALALTACSSSGAAANDAGQTASSRPDAVIDARKDTSVQGRLDSGVDAHHSGDSSPSGDAGTRDARADATPEAAARVDADPFEYYDAGPAIVANVDDAGWSVLPGMPGTNGGYARAIYVDSVGGSDDNTGTSTTTALQGIGTSSKLQTLLQDAPSGQSIVVVLKPGSSWTTSPADQMNPPLGGTASYPLLITGSRWPGSSGTPRARIGGMIYLGHSHTAIEGLEIGPGASAGFNEGIHIPSGGETDFLIEDNLITGYINLIEATGSQTEPISNLRVRRNYLFGSCGSGAVVAFDGQDIAGALFEENFFDWNGAVTGQCNYEDGGLIPPYSVPTNENPLAHDVYFADDGVRVVALNVTFHGNLFSRTLQSVKGPYTGLMDDNLFYNYLNGGYLGTWGSAFTNNVLVNGGGFGTALDNNHSPNEIPSRQTSFCNNLHYNEGTPYAADYAFVSQNMAGVNLVYSHNVIDGFQRAFEFEDPVCFGYEVTNNIIQTDSFYEIQNPWPLAQCPASFAGNEYHSPAGDTSASSSGYGLERPGPVYSDFAAAEAFIHEDAGVYESSAFAFADPSRNIASYLETTTPPLAAAGANPTLLTYLALIRAQSLTAHSWNPALSVGAINAYLRAGHSVTGGKPLTYADGGGCR